MQHLSQSLNSDWVSGSACYCSLGSSASLKQIFTHSKLQIRDFNLERSKQTLNIASVYYLELFRWQLLPDWMSFCLSHSVFITRIWLQYLNSLVFGIVYECNILLKPYNVLLMVHSWPKILLLWNLNFKRSFSLAFGRGWIVLHCHGEWIIHK